MGGVTQSVWSRRLPGVVALALAAMRVVAGSPLPAQEPAIRAYVEPEEVEVGEPFRLNVEVSGVREVEYVALPTGLWFASIPREGSLPVSTETTTTEGVQSVGVITFSYSFVARWAGSHEVGSVSVTADGRSLQADPFTMFVTIPEGAEELEPTTELNLSDLVMRPGYPDLSDAPGGVLAQASLNTEQVWLGAEFVLVVEVFGVSEMDDAPVLPDMSGFAERIAVFGRGASRGPEHPSVHRTYRFRALTTGEFEIGPVRVTAAGRTMLTEPITLRVGRSPPEPVRVPEDLRATATADKRRVYVGEPVTVAYRVLSRGGGGPGYGGGWSVDPSDTLVLPPLENLRVRRLPVWRGSWQRLAVGGRMYHNASEHRVAFAPLQPGETLIGPALLQVQIHQWSREFRGGRGRTQGTWTPMTLVTDAMPLEVVALPAESRPASFQGHVGTLSVVSWVDRTSMQVGDTVTVRVEVSGDWVGPETPHPVITFPPGFAISGPEIDHDIPRIGFDVGGTRLYVYRLVASREGSYRILPVEVSWFDPESESYGISNSGPFDLTVLSAGRE